MTMDVNVQEDLNAVNDQLTKLVEELNEKYGPGSLDPATGVFTPTPADTSDEGTDQDTTTAAA